MFAVTNLDDIVVLSLYFGQVNGRTDVEWRIVAGQYVGFSAILVASIVGAFGAGYLSENVIAHLGLVPLLLGVRAAIDVWRYRGQVDVDDPEVVESGGPTVHHVAAVTFANGGDNIGVYVPVFAAASNGGITIYSAVFLVMVALWCAAGRFLATRPPIARLLERWGHVLMPIVLIGIGVVLLAEAEHSAVEPTTPQATGRFSVGRR